MEDGQGAVFIFSQVVPGGPQGCAANYSSLDPEDSLETVNFRHEVAGLYLKEIQRGPWTGGPDGGTPANKIEFFYAAENPGSWLAACGGIGAEQWLVTTITASEEVPRTVNLLYGRCRYDESPDVNHCALVRPHARKQLLGTEDGRHRGRRSCRSSNS